MIARILRPVLTVRRSLLLVGTTVVALTFPAAAMANLYTLTSKPITRNQGFKLRIDAYNTATGYGGPNESDLTIFLVRSHGHVTQTSAYTFNYHSKLSGKGNLSSGHLKGTFPAGRGSIDMTFHGSGSPSTARGQCQGAPGKKLSGTLSGSLTLKADKLGTVRLSSTPATLSTAADNCNPPAPCPSHGYLLEGYHGGYTVCASKSKSTSAVREVIRVDRQGDWMKKPQAYGWAFQYTYAAKDEPTGDYSPGAGESSATVNGASGIKGSASYSGHSSCSQATGKLTGDLWVKMAALGAVKPFAAAKNGTLSACQQHS